MLLTLFVVQTVVEVVYEKIDEVFTHFLMVEQEVVELLVLVVVLGQSLLGLIVHGVRKVLFAVGLCAAFVAIELNCINWQGLFVDPCARCNLPSADYWAVTMASF